MIDVLFLQVFVTGSTEELSKFAIFVFFSEKWKSLREPKDGVLQASCVALAFASLENILYVHRYGGGVLLYRLFFATASHIGWTALAGWSWATVRTKVRSPTTEEALRFAAPYLFVGAILHGVYNSLAHFNVTFLFMSLVILTVTIAITLLKESDENSPFRRYSLSDWIEAARRLLAVAKQDPFDWVARQRAGVYLLHGGKLDRAFTVFNEAAYIRSDLPYARAYREAVRILEGDEDAVFPFKLALFEMPPDGRASFERNLRKAARRLPRWPVVAAALQGGVSAPSRPECNKAALRRPWM